MSKFETVAVWALVILMCAYAVTLILERAWSKRRKKNAPAHDEYDEDLLKSAVRITGVDRQAITQASKPRYAVRNSGVTLDERDIYDLEYDKVGV